MSKKIEHKDGDGKVIRTFLIDDLTVACQELWQYLTNTFQLKDFIVAHYPFGIIVYDTSKEVRVDYLDEIVPEYWDAYPILINYMGPMPS